MAHWKLFFFLGFPFSNVLQINTELSKRLLKWGKLQPENLAAWTEVSIRVKAMVAKGNMDMYGMPLMHLFTISLWRKIIFL